MVQKALKVLGFASDEVEVRLLTCVVFLHCLDLPEPVENSGRNHSFGQLSLRPGSPRISQVQ